MVVLLGLVLLAAWGVSIEGAASEENSEDYQAEGDATHVGRIEWQWALTPKDGSIQTLPPAVQKKVMATLNLSLGFRVHLLSDAICLDVIRNHYDESLARIGAAKVQGSYRCDVCWAAVLTQEGGFFLDLDSELQDYQFDVEAMHEGCMVGRLILTSEDVSSQALPPAVQDSVNHTLNLSLGSMVRLLSDAMCLDVIRNHHDESMARIGAAKMQGSYRADVGRAAVLAQEGGAYLDVNFELEDYHVEGDATHEGRMPWQLVLTSKDGSMQALPPAVQKRWNHTLNLSLGPMVHLQSDAMCLGVIGNHYDENMARIGVAEMQGSYRGVVRAVAPDISLAADYIDQFSLPECASKISSMSIAALTRIVTLGPGDSLHSSTQYVRICSTVFRMAGDSVVPIFFVNGDLRVRDRDGYVQDHHVNLRPPRNFAIHHGRRRHGLQVQ